MEHLSYKGECSVHECLHIKVFKKAGLGYMDKMLSGY